MSRSRSSSHTPVPYTTIKALVDLIVNENLNTTRAQGLGDAFDRVAWPSSGKVTVYVSGLPTDNSTISRIQVAVRSRFETPYGEKKQFMHLPIKHVRIRGEAIVVTADPGRVCKMAPGPWAK